MDLAKTLIRSVARTFYELHHVLVVDALMVHSALSVDDMYHLTSVQPKDLRKHLGRLKEDRLVSVQQRQEVKQGTSRPVHRDYYYINFHTCIDAIKYRLFELTEKIKKIHQPTEEKKDYYCPRCKAQYTQMEVLDRPSIDGFLCRRCDHTLERDDMFAATHAGHERHSKLMSQIGPLLDLLRRIDAVEIPQNDFQTALSVAIPVRRNPNTHPTQIYVPVKEENKPSASRLNQESMLDLDVTIASEEGREEAERKAKERKAAQEKQNALPSWYTESTIGLKADPTSPVTNTAPTSSALANGETTIKEDPDKKDGIINANDQQLADYFAKLEEEKRNALPPESSSEDEDDEDGFEDVELGANGTGTGTNAVGTPSSSVSRQPSAPPSSAAVNGSGKKRRASDDEPMMNGALGSSGTGTPVNGESPSKKIKLEPGFEGGAVTAPATTAVKNEDVDSDEDEEFEDAL